MSDSFKHPNDEKKVHFRLNLVSNMNSKWIVYITTISFFISATLSILASNVLENLHSFLALLVVFIIIVIGILFDMIGTAVTAADETPFHAMASRKYYGARQSIKLIRNANKVSSFCNDVIGDISGVISGTASALIVQKLTFGLNALLSVFISISVTGLVAAMTIGGKAFGKTIAIENSNYIVYKVGVISAFFGGKLRLGKAKK